MNDLHLNWYHRFFQSYMTWRDAVLFAVLSAALQPWMVELRLLAQHSFDVTYLTGHLVHLNWQHWLMNMLALLMLPLLMPYVRRIYFWLAAVALSMFISILLVVCDQLIHQQLASYVGFSGVLHGLYVFFACAGLSQCRSQAGIYWQSWFLLVGIVLKVVYEMLVQPTHSVDFLAAPVVFAAHMDGVIGGMILGMASYLVYVVSDKR